MQAGKSGTDERPAHRAYKPGVRTLAAGFACMAAISTSAGPWQIEQRPAGVAHVNSVHRTFHGLAPENGRPVPHVCKKIEQNERLVLRCGPSAEAEGLVHASRIVRLGPLPQPVAPSNPNPLPRTDLVDVLPDPTRALEAEPTEGSFSVTQPAPDVTLTAAAGNAAQVARALAPEPNPEPAQETHQAAEPERQPQPAALSEPREPEIRLVIDKVPSGYLVASLGDSERVVSILQAAGDADYQLLKRGPYVGRVSLGVFSIRANAERRADGVAKRGIDAELIVRASQVAIDRRAATRTLARAE